MRLSARVDYALRAVAELAAANAPRTVEQLSGAQKIPNKYLESILGELRRGVCCAASEARTAATDWPDRPRRSASPMSSGRSDGELANVRGSRPEHLEYEGAAASLQEVWIALRASERAILEGVTLAHVASGTLPESVSALVANPNAWV